MKYPFSHCLEPRWVTNPYTGDSLIASCGHCVSCLMNKARRNSTLCDLESDYSRYTAFVTTTYDDDSVPRALLFSYNNMAKIMEKYFFYFERLLL